MRLRSVTYPYICYLRNQLRVVTVDRRVDDVQTQLKQVVGFAFRKIICVDTEINSSAEDSRNAWASSTGYDSIKPCLQVKDLGTRAVGCGSYDRCQSRVWKRRGATLTSGNELSSVKQPSRRNELPYFQNPTVGKKSRRWEVAGIDKSGHISWNNKTNPKIVENVSQGGTSSNLCVL